MMLYAYVPQVQAYFPKTPSFAGTPCRKLGSDILLTVPFV